MDIGDLLVFKGKQEADKVQVGELHEETEDYGIHLEGSLDNLEEEIQAMDACHDGKLLDECNLQDYNHEAGEELVVDSNLEDNLG